MDRALLLKQKSAELLDSIQGWATENLGLTKNESLSLTLKIAPRKARVNQVVWTTAVWDSELSTEDWASIKNVFRGRSSMLAIVEMFERSGNRPVPAGYLGLGACSVTNMNTLMRRAGIWIGLRTQSRKRGYLRTPLQWPDTPIRFCHLNRR